jgi:hypothetical protein
LLLAAAENVDLWSACTLRHAGYHLAQAELAQQAQQAPQQAQQQGPSPLQQLLDAVAEPLPEGACLPPCPACLPA